MSKQHLSRKIRFVPKAQNRSSGALGTDAPYQFSFTNAQREPSPATRRTNAFPISASQCRLVVPASPHA